MDQAVETLVVGAGISGLAYAYARGTDADVLVLEASERPGGLVHTIDVDARPGLRYERGPEALSGSARAVRTMADELGVAMHDADKHASKRYVIKRGLPVEVPLSPPKLVTTRLLSPLAKLRLATEPFRNSTKSLEGSIAEFARHRLGREALETLVDPMVSGIHAGDPAELSLRACFPQLVAMIQQHGSIFNALRAQQRATKSAPTPGLWKPAGGMQLLTTALADKLGSRLKTGVKVRSIESAGRGFKIRTDLGRVDAQNIVLAVPLRAATTLLNSTLPEAADELRTMRCESLVGIFHAYTREQIEHPLDGFGYLVPRAENLQHLGTLFSSTIEPACVPEGNVLLRTLAGGARYPDLVEKGDAELARIASQEVGTILSTFGEPVWKRIVRYPEALPRLDLKHPERLERLHQLLPRNLCVLGNFTRGVGLSSLVDQALELASAHQAEESVLAQGAGWTPCP